MATELKTVSQVVEFGREMMKFSEERCELKKLTTDQMKILNQLSSLGNRLTRTGTAYGPQPEEFTEQEMNLMDEFAQGKISF